jgi:hypothetical protein
VLGLRESVALVLYLLRPPAGTGRRDPRSLAIDYAQPAVEALASSRCGHRPGQDLEQATPRSTAPELALYHPVGAMLEQRESEHEGVAGGRTQTPVTE